MWRWIFGVALVLVLGLGGFAIYAIQSTNRIVKKVAEGVVGGAIQAISPRTHGNMPKIRTLEDVMQDQTPEAVALLSGGQWYLIRDFNAARAIGFYARSPGLFGAILGQGRCPTDVERVAIEPLVKGIVSKPISTCTGPHTDISALLALAQPAALEEAVGQSLAQWHALDGRMGMDAGLYPANRNDAPRFDYRCSYQFPHVWTEQGDTRPYLITRYEEGIRNAMAPIFTTVGPRDLWVDNGYTSSYVMQPTEGLDTSEEGWAVGTDFTFMTRGDVRRKVPGLSVYRPEVTFKGSLAECEVFASVDFSSLWQEDRDLSQLERAWEVGVVIEPGAGTQNDWDRIVTSQPRASRPSQNKFTYRHFRLP